jgi:diguanylate cyclase (GGDEF)-like protein/PAS domain S-box-containing protein
MTSLKNRIIASVIAICLMGLWALSWFLSMTLQKDMEQLLGAQQLATVTVVAQEVSQELANRLQDLESVARTIPAETLKDGAATQELLQNRPLLSHRFNAGIYVTRLDGVASASLPADLDRLGVNYLDRDYIRNTLQHGASSVGEPVIGKRLGAPIIGLAAPIRDEQGAVIGALAGVIDLSAPSFLDRFTTHRIGNTGGLQLITPKSRQVVTDRSQVMEQLPPVGTNLVMDRFLSGYDGWAVMTSPQGVDILSANMRIRETGWIAGSMLPTEEAFAPTRSMQRRFLWGTLLLTLVAGGLVWCMLHHHLRPLVTTTKAIQDMANAKTDLQRLAMDRSDEVGALIKGVNHLIETIAQRESALTQSDQTLRNILDTTLDGFWRANAAGGLVDVNAAYCQQSGFSRDELLSMNIADLEALEQPSDTQQHIGRIVKDGHDQFESVHRRKNGSTWFVGVSTIFSKQNGGEFIAFLRDISDRKQAQERLQLAASVFTHAREGIMITAPDGAIIEVNDTFTRITGYTRDEVLGKNPRLLSSGRQDKSFYAHLWSDLESKGYWSGEVWNRRKNGEVYAEMQTISIVRDTQGKTQSYLALFSDITSIKENQHKLERITHFDALTNLPNRVLLSDRLQQSMAQSLRRGQRLAVVFLDLDGFKSINDQHGHEAGDHLLVALSENLKLVLRDGDTLARMGGDEFAVVMVDLDEVSNCGPVLNRLLLAAAQPVQVGEALLQVSASLGVTFYPQAEDVDDEQLLRQASQAMYQAKQAGKQRYHVFDPEQDRAVRGHYEGLDTIRQALEHNEFVLFYQPKVNMREGVVVGAEALIRWQHPTQGLLSPDKFLPLIEEDPLSISVGEWVIETALTQMDTWRAAGLSIPISVNVGARQLQQPQFFARLREALAHHPKVRPGDLELELLETSALAELTSVSKLIENCRDIGVSFALDDFGTGYSSLTYLKSLPVALLKIDQGFVRDMLDDPDDLAILDGVIGLSQAFRREVIAEGVETVEHGEMLLRMGCDLAQGYGIARPMPAHALPAWKETWQPDPSWSQAPKCERGDLPLLMARVELRAWAKAMELYVGGERDQPPTLDQRTCAFGLWLNDHGAAHYGEQADFVVLQALHHQLHGMAAHLYALMVQSEAVQAAAGLKGLRGVLAALLLHLNQLIHSTATHTRI